MERLEPDESLSHAVNMVFAGWKDDVAAIRSLYKERKYRKCAVLCTERLEPVVCSL